MSEIRNYVSQHTPLTNAYVKANGNNKDYLFLIYLFTFLDFVFFCFVLMLILVSFSFLTCNYLKRNRIYKKRKKQ